MHDRRARSRAATQRATVIVLSALLAGCSSSSGLNTGPLDGGVPDGPTLDAAGRFPDAGRPDAATGPMLTLSLDPTLDQPGDDVKATSIADAKLFDQSGAVKSRATLSSGGAVFALAGMSAGDYFIEINGDAADMVPTRIDDPARSLSQTVGKKLRSSYVGPAGTPTYRINTYSAGQMESPVVKYSDGTTIPGEQPYLIVTLGTPKVEFRLMGTAALLSTISPNSVHSYDSTAFDAWMINTTNLDHHGDMFSADGGAATCQGCHWYGGWQEYAFSVITPTNGWCYRCHYGTGGSSAGFVDPTQ